MNKKILLIFVMIMALLLIGISCSNNATKPKNTATGSGSNLTNDTDILNDLKTAALGGLGGSLEIKKNNTTIHYPLITL